MGTVAGRIREAMELREMTQSDLVRATGISKSSISTYLSGDYIPKQLNTEKIARALDVSAAWLSGQDVPMKREYGGEGIPGVVQLRKKPRLGTIACGVPILAEENLDGYDYVPDAINCDFTLKCRGDSMTGARILDGDIVYIRSQPQVENGEIAAVLIDNEATLKRVYIYSNQVVLQAENPAYAPLVYTGTDLEKITIIGKAVAFTSEVK